MAIDYYRQVPDAVTDIIVSRVLRASEIGLVVWCIFVRPALDVEEVCTPCGVLKSFRVATLQ